MVDDEKLRNINDVLRTEVQSIDSILKIKNSIDTTDIKNLIKLYKQIGLLVVYESSLLFTNTTKFLNLAFKNKDEKKNLKIRLVYNPKSYRLFRRYISYTRRHKYLTLLICI